MCLFCRKYGPKSVLNINVINKKSRGVIFYLSEAELRLSLKDKMVSQKPGDNHSGEKTALGNSPAILDENLQRLDRLANLGTLSAGIAHEIKNALVPIKTFVEMMLEKSDDRELAVTVEREVKRLDSMVSQMLRFASPRPTTFTAVQVHDVLDISLRLLQHQITGKMISVKRDFRAVPGIVRGDEAQLQQVIMNLLLNALEAMGTSGALTISTEIIEENGGTHLMHVNIQDTGMGIKKENLERVFEPFFTTKKNGTGLGLAISQRVAREHHGKIEAQSEPGKGSTFVISLPLMK
jgi:signal transduction histidine kinase